MGALLNRNRRNDDLQENLINPSTAEDDDQEIKTATVRPDIHIDRNSLRLVRDTTDTEHYLLKFNFEVSAPEAQLNIYFIGSDVINTGQDIRIEADEDHEIKVGAGLDQVFHEESVVLDVSKYTERQLMERNRPIWPIILEMTSPSFAEY